MQAVAACMAIIWHVQVAIGLKFWALENPLGLLRHFLGRPEFTFKQWQYGDGREKPTDVWGWFNNPKPTVADRPLDFERWGSERVQDGFDRAAVRAMTPKGFANAFYKANR
jgi:hypothetical protein